MGEKFRGERGPMDQIENEFGPEVARVLQRLQKNAEGKDFESMMNTVQRMLASDGVKISDEQFEDLKRVLLDHKRDLGLDSEAK